MATHGGGAANAVARQFQFSVPCNCKSLGRRRATGEIEVRPQRNRQTLKLGELHASIAAEVASWPDITPVELRAWLLWTHQGMASVGFVHNTLVQLDLTHKKDRADSSAWLGGRGNAS